MKTVIKDKEKLSENLQGPLFDYVDDRFCEQDIISACPYFDGYGSCKLFDKELNAMNEDDYYLRCQQCLDCFEAVNED